MEVREGAAGVGSVKRAGATARVRRVAAIARVFAIEELAARVKHHVSDSIALVKLSMEYCRRMMEVEGMWGGAGGHGGNDPDPIAVSPEAAAGFPDLRKKLRGRVARNFTIAIAPHFPQALLPSDIGIDFMVCTALLHPKR
ncbi:hypothetical protein T484DRAFT_1922517 [Baffinella frigidus]|nr:hypothetical protein T484DRAFT_1922517 [Cryptophyta sp. CCMP2293]